MDAGATQVPVNASSLGDPTHPTTAVYQILESSAVDYINSKRFLFLVVLFKAALFL